MLIVDVDLGNSFIDRSPDLLKRLGDYSLNDFESYFVSLRQSEKYGRPRLIVQSSMNEINGNEKSPSTINIPQLFLSSQFSLSDPSTFNLVFPGLIPSSSHSFDQQKSRTTSTSSDKSEGSTRRPSTPNGLPPRFVRSICKQKKKKKEMLCVV